MKIIEPSATIIEDELSQLSVYQRIDRCAAVCYQRPPKPTEEEAVEFCRGMVKRGHYATLEMAQIHLTITPHDLVIGKYLNKFPVFGEGKTILSGSIRAFIEASCFYIPVAVFLGQNFPLFFPKREYTETDTRFAEPHEIPWQHKYVAVRFIVNRAVSHELVRHRPCSFLQESQRYCRYEDDVVFIRPEWASEYHLSAGFETDCAHAETRYKLYLGEGLKPQQARSVLPNSTKTELIVYANLPEWQHIFDLRCSPAADPEMRRVMIPLREEFKAKYPEVGW